MKMIRDELIQLMELLDKYGECIKEELYKESEIDTKEKLAAQIIMQNHIKVIGEIREMICYDLQEE